MKGDMPDFKAILAQVADGASLSVDDAKMAFDVMMSGDATPSQMGAFLMALRLRGETVDEITGGVMTMREKMTAIRAPGDAFDIVGTGGDGMGTLNISTGTALITAACGLPVAKHGNRAASSLTGAADVLSELGVNIDADFPVIERCLAEAGICFMMAPRHHGAMRNVGPTRVELGTRTIFNILGPMSNPASVRRQLIGVFSRDWLEPMAQTLKTLGSERIWVVHGGDGSDELTTTGVSHVVALEDGEIRSFDLTPDAAGLATATLDELKGGDAAFNADAIRTLVAGEQTAYRDVVCYGTAAALLIAERVDNLVDGVQAAAEAIDGGKAGDVLHRLVKISNSEPPDE